MKASDIIQALLNNRYTNDELNQVAQAIKHARHNMAISNKFTLRVGQDVKFNHAGVAYNGSIKKINRTTMTVTTDKGTWKVPANMLTPV
jgi:hypothetical protein